MSTPTFLLTYGISAVDSNDLAALTLCEMRNRFPVLNQLITVPRIVITGAPGSGKTDCLKRLRQDPAFAQFVFFEELARQLLEEDPTYRQRWPEFHREIYARQTEREKQIEGRPFITDRGTVDAFAFSPDTAAEVGTTIRTEYLRYTAVVQLESAAGLGEPFYRRDQIRNESIDEAMAIERAIQTVWKGHVSYHWIEAKIDFEAKFDQFREVLQTLAESGSPTIR